MNVITVSLILFLTSFPVVNAIAKPPYNPQSDPQWVADEARLETLIPSEKISDQERCLMLWNTWWPWAKKGNLEARAGLLAYVFPTASDSGILIPPGSAGDYVSQVRNALILGANIASADSGQDKKLQDEYKDTFELLYKLYLNDGSRGSAFAECMKDRPPRECVYNYGDLFPSFQQYAVQIDALVVQGMRPKCKFPPSSHHH